MNVRLILLPLLVCGWLVCVPPQVVSAKAEETPSSAADPEHAGEHTAGEHGHGAHIGEKDVNTDPAELKADLAIYTLVVFLLLFFLLWTFAWKPISQALDQRAEGIRKNIADAAAANQKAEQLLAEHQKQLDHAQIEVKEILAEARRDADHTKQDIIATAQREAEATRNRAVNDIERARDAALKDLFDHMSGQVELAIEHVLGRGLTGEDQSRLIDEALAQFAEQSK